MDQREPADTITVNWTWLPYSVQLVSATMPVINAMMNWRTTFFSPHRQRVGGPFYAGLVRVFRLMRSTNGVSVQFVSTRLILAVPCIMIVTLKTQQNE